MPDIKLKDFPLTTPDEDPAGKLSEMVVNTKYEDLPLETLDVAKKAIFDTIAVTIAGSKWECVPDVVDLVRGWGSKDESKILIYGDKVPAIQAAFANGVMSRAIDMGDVHERAGHVTEWLVPTLLSSLPLAKKTVTGKDFLIAYVVGAEWSVRHILSNNGSLHAAVGIPGEVNGPISNTAAVSRLLGSNVMQTWNAVGIAYSVHGMGEMQKYAEGTQMARMQHAFAGDTAIKATLLAQRGITGPRGVYMGVPAGFLRHVEWSGIEPDYGPHILVDNLGKVWEFSDGLSMKPYSSCKYTHSFISAMTTLMKNNNIDYREIADVYCVGSEGARMTIEPEGTKWNPTNPPEAMFSTPYAVSHAAMRGNVFLDAFTPEEIGNPEKHELIKKVRVECDPALKSPFEGYTVEVTLKNGQKYKETNDYVLGNKMNPMGWEELKKKFWNCVPYSAVALPKEKFQAAIDICMNLEDVADMNDLINALTPDE